MLRRTSPYTDAKGQLHAQIETYPPKGWPIYFCGLVKVSLFDSARKAWRVIARVAGRSSDAIPERQQLDAGTLVYRLARTAGDIDKINLRFQAIAFQRRRDEENLSLILAEGITQKRAAQTLRKCYGVATLVAGTIQELGFEVYPTPDKPGYAEIVGLPDPDPEDEDGEAMTAANELLDCIKDMVVWPQPMKMDAPRPLNE